jgi:RecJ-like exonuclease
MPVAEMHCPSHKIALVPAGPCRLCEGKGTVTITDRDRGDEQHLCMLCLGVGTVWDCPLCEKEYDEMMQALFGPLKA